MVSVWSRLLIGQTQSNNGLRLPNWEFKATPFIENKGLTQAKKEFLGEIMPKKSKEIAAVADAIPLIDPNTLYQMLGAARYANHLSSQTKSDVIRFGKVVRDNKLYLPLGFNNFDDFLDSDFSPVARTTFYRELELFENEGEQYDLFNEWKIPVRLRRQLTSGDIAIDGDEIVIAGTERVSLTNSGSIKAILEQLVKEKIKATSDAAKATEKLESTNRKLEAAVVVRDSLQSEIDERDAKTPYEETLGNLQVAFMNHAAIVEGMDPQEREERARPDMEIFETHFRKLQEAYGVAEWQLHLRDVQAKEALA